MTKKERIRELENKIVELEARIRVLESKYLWVYQIPEYSSSEWTVTCGNTTRQETNDITIQ